MTAARHIAVIDIGKTNVKLALVDRVSLQEIDVVTRPNTVLAGPPWPHFDVEGHWDFLLHSLRKFQLKHGIDGISITTHGASIVLLDFKGELAAPILDYEHTAIDNLSDAYYELRPEFAETGSPRLPQGLNVGAQLYWQFQQEPHLLNHVETIVTYPQYWAYKLSGECAVDICSVACHTDLWNPYEGCYSSLVDKLGIRGKLGPVRRPKEVIGTLLEQVSLQTGIPEKTPVLCGIHDSNASLYAHSLSHKPPFCVVSTGTWVINMSVTEAPTELDENRDTLMNVSALGQLVPTARFMGGREFELVQQGYPLIATMTDAQETLEKNTMLLPAIESSSGPYAGCSANWDPSEPALGTAEREIALSFYLALMSNECLDLVAGEGRIIVEGPFARNQFYLDMLQAASDLSITACQSTTGTSIGAALLFGSEGTNVEASPSAKLDKKYLHALRDYALQWQQSAELARQTI